jgi:hypothetical protein
MTNEKPIEPTPDSAPGDQPTELATAAAAPAADASQPAANAAQPATKPPATVSPGPDLGDRLGALGREAAAAGERFGREAQAAGERLQRDPAVIGAADWASRAWGLLVLAIGLWFLADVTLGFDMPSLAWRELWPLLLIVAGLAIVFRGLARRR